jgi:hypothetical protein
LTSKGIRRWRKRTNPETINHAIINIEMNTSLSLVDLPHEALGHVASYLPVPSVPLLVVALFPPSASSGSDSKYCFKSAIVSAGRSVLPDDANSELDFGSLEKRLALKLTDDDVAAVLKCINAKYTLRRLNMWGLENITGRGLESLS